MDTDRIYCLKCKEFTDTDNKLNTKLGNGRPVLKGTCAKCGTKKARFLKRQYGVDETNPCGGDLVSSIGQVTKDIKLPWAKFPGELHIPGMNFAGPGTNVDKRLNPSGSYKEWSKPVDRVDNAAYIHDLAYTQFKDTPTRNLADKMLLEQVDAIPNPTFREKVERAIIKPIISAKVKFGLGEVRAPLGCGYNKGRMNGVFKR